MASQERDYDSIHVADQVQSDASDTLRSSATAATFTSAPSAEEVAEDSLDDFCPKCCIPLSDPVHFGWCLRCGYCRYLENARPIEPMEVMIDPEIRSGIELLLQLSRALKKGVKVTPTLARHCDLLYGMARLIKTKAQSGQDVNGYRDLLRLLSKKYTKGQTDVDLGTFDELFQTISQRYKAELDRSNRASDALNMPIPYLEFVPEWLAVLACGLFICAAGSYMAQMNFRGHGGLRIFWAQSEILLGLFMLVAAQLTAFLEIVPSGLRFRKCLMVISYDLWWAVWQRLPVTRWAAWFLGWGVGLCVCGGVVLARLIRL